MPLRASDSRRGCRPYTVQSFILSAIGYRYSRDAAARRSHLSQRFCGVGADSRCGRRRETRPHRGVAENAAGRKDGCRRPSGHRERADAGLGTALRRGVRGAGRRARTYFQGWKCVRAGRSWRSPPQPDGLSWHGGPVRPPATSCGLESESFFESLSCRHPHFPEEYGGCSQSYSGSFLRRMSHRLASSRADSAARLDPFRFRSRPRRRLRSPARATCPAS